jgi:hypothetical protein
MRGASQPAAPLTMPPHEPWPAGEESSAKEQDWSTLQYARLSVIWRLSFRGELPWFNFTQPALPNKAHVVG